MRVLLLVLLVSAICCVSCTQNKFGQRSTQPAYPIGSAEFSNATPPRFHDLTTGMSEQAVLSAVGEPTSESDIYPPGRILDPPVGKRYAYRLKDGEGVVSVDFDMDMRVARIFWRDRD